VGKNKLAHFEENELFEHVFEPPFGDAFHDTSPLKGNWNSFFRNKHPLVLELGCGKGEYTVGLARLNPKTNYIGVDIKGARIWRGAKTVEEEQLKNAAFLRTKIEFIPSFFAENEVTEIWLTFSDPQKKDKREKHRLTHPRFLKKYQQILQDTGWVHVKTDSRFLMEYCLTVLDELSIKPAIASFDIYGKDWEILTHKEQEALGIRTFYEKKFMATGSKIHYLKFQLPLKPIVL
jgi:tRNA (guanine-N7-)-methyltransferase